MKQIFFIILCVLLPHVILASDPVREIQQSHITSNLPDTFEDFQNILGRDLKEYFIHRLNRQVEIKYELLSKAPTQSGVSYPKFYAWVNVKENDNIVESGAVRLAAINKIKVEVTDFVSKQQIHASKNILNSIFPRSLCDNIREKAN